VRNRSTPNVSGFGASAHNAVNSENQLTAAISTRRRPTMSVMLPAVSAPMSIYSLTDAGRRALLDWVAEYHAPPAPRDPFALQALLFDMVAPEDAITVLKVFIEEQDKIAERHEWQAARLRALDTPLLRERLRGRPTGEHARIGRLKAHVFQGKAAAARQQADWAREAIALVRDGEPP